MQVIKLGARLGGATKELLPNLDTYKNNEKSTIPLRFLFFGGCFGEANLLIFVRPSVRAAFFLNPIRDCVFWHAQKLRILFVIIFMRSPPKMHGQVRWSKFRSRDLTAKNTIVQSVGQKFRPRDWTAQKHRKIQSCRPTDPPRPKDPS